MKQPKSRYAPILFGISVCVSTALATTSAATPDPTDASAAVPAMKYESPFATYRQLGEDKSTVWRDANDTVGKIGGWRAYAREAARSREAEEAGKPKSTAPARVPPAQAAPDTSHAPVAPAVAPTPTHKHGG